MLKQGLNYKLLQKLSPQQIQLMKLIQLPTQAFEERLKQENAEAPGGEVNLAPDGKRKERAQKRWAAFKARVAAKKMVKKQAGPGVQ